MTRRLELRHFACPTCGRLASLPFNAAWCLHASSNFQPRPPESLESDWTRMTNVIHVEAEPAQETQWVVVEYRNTIDLDPRPADERTHRVVSEPMSREAAYAEAERRPRDPGRPLHMHAFHAYPLDLCNEEMRRTDADHGTTAEAG